jgi:hypothetical protein
MAIFAFFAAFLCELGGLGFVAASNQNPWKRKERQGSAKLAKKIAPVNGNTARGGSAWKTVFCML